VNAQTNPWQVLLGAPSDAAEPWVRPGLLLRAHNGIGGLTEVEYKPSTAFDNEGGDSRPDLPLVTWVVTAVRRTDGLCTPPSGVDPFDPVQNPCIDAGHEIVREIAYEGGRFDPDEREFRGFRTVTETDADGNTRVVTFDQEEFTRGKIERDERFAGGTKLVRRERFAWNTRTSLSRTQVYLAEHRAVEYDPDYAGGDPDLDPKKQCVMNGNNEPDDWGRIVYTCTRGCSSSEPGPAVANLCETGVVLGQVSTVTDWANPIGGSSVRERPNWVCTEYFTGQSYTTLNTKYFLYDNLGVAGQVSKGNVTLVTTQLGPSLGDGDDPSVAMTYDPTYGNLLTTTDPNGNCSRNDFAISPFALYPSGEEALCDTVHRVEKTWDLVFGKPLTITDPNDQTTTYEYDPLGRPTCEARPEDDCATRPTVEYVYHWGVPGAGSDEEKLSYVEVRRPKPDVYTGQIVSRTYLDALGRKRLSTVERVIGGSTSVATVVVGQTVYDAGGRVQKVFADYVKGASLVIHPSSSEFTEYRYTLNGNPSGYTDPLGRVYQVIPPDGRETTTRYHGVWTEVADADGHTTKVEKDEFGREVRKEHHEGSSNARLWFDYQYDGLGRLLETKTSGDPGTIVTQVYDSLGRMIERTDFDSGTWEYGYDASGNLVYRDDPKADQHVEWCYDGLNRPTLRCVYSNGNDPVSFDPCASANECGGASFVDSKRWYDEPSVGNNRIGRLWKVTRGDGSLDEELSYDKRGRVKKSRKRVLGIEPPSMEFSYDSADRLTVITYPDGEEIGQYYYESGQLALSDAHVSAITYDRFGRVEQLTHTNGREEYFGFWDETQNFRLKTLQTTRLSDGTNAILQDYYYDGVGRLGQIDDRRSAPGRVLNDARFQYDGLGRLTSVYETPRYDNPQKHNDETFGYDPIGNVSAKSKGVDPTLPIAYGPGPHQADSHGSITDMPYDANGQRERKDLSGGSSEVYDYDPLGRLTRITFPSTGRTVDFTYDYRDRRVARTVNGGTPYRYFNRYVESADGLLTKYYYAGDRLVATVEDEDSQFSEVDPGTGPGRDPWVLPSLVVYAVGGV
jgi:YD repeat-containing protein